MPEYNGYPVQSWVFTETWWAATTRAPGLGSMTDYVRRALLAIMAGIRGSYQPRADSCAKRRGESRAFAKGGPAPASAFPGK